MRLPSNHVQPLYVSSATTRKMEQSLGTMDYNREFEFYKMLDEGLCGGDTPAFKRETVWTFNRLNEKGEQDHELPVEELPGKLRRIPRHWLGIDFISERKTLREHFQPA